MGERIITPETSKSEMEPQPKLRFLEIGSSDTPVLDRIFGMYTKEQGEPFANLFLDKQETEREYVRVDIHPESLSKQEKFLLPEHSRSSYFDTKTWFRGYDEKEEEIIKKRFVPQEISFKIREQVNSGALHEEFLQYLRQRADYLYGVVRGLSAEQISDDEELQKKLDAYENAKLRRRLGNIFSEGKDDEIAMVQYREFLNNIEQNLKEFKQLLEAYKDDFILAHLTKKLREEPESEEYLKTFGLDKKKIEKLKQMQFSVAANASELPFKEHSFDLLLAKDILGQETFESPEMKWVQNAKEVADELRRGYQKFLIFEEANRVVADNGYFVIVETITPNNFYEAFEDLKRYIEMIDKPRKKDVKKEILSDLRSATILAKSRALIKTVSDKFEQNERTRKRKKGAHIEHHDDLSNLIKSLSEENGFKVVQEGEHQKGLKIAQEMGLDAEKLKNTHLIYAWSLVSLTSHDVYVAVLQKTKSPDHKK